MQGHSREQRAKIQREIDRFFGRNIEIGPRAMAALHGDYVDQKDAVNRDSIFFALLSGMPGLLSTLIDDKEALGHLLDTWRKAGPRLSYGAEVRGGKLRWGKWKDVIQCLTDARG